MEKRGDISPRTPHLSDEEKRAAEGGTAPPADTNLQDRLAQEAQRGAAQQRGQTPPQPERDW